MIEALAKSKIFLWLTATAVASVVMMSYFSSYIYPRTEGYKLEGRMSRMEKRIEHRLDRIENLLSDALKRKDQ